ncbi:MAG: hypothetical protein R6V07_16670, partial [Armatimonadota bacterium]
MRRPHPAIVLLLALLFAGQTVATATACERIEEVEHACCGETAPPPVPHDCGCYDAPETPVTAEPVVQVQPPPIIATLSPAPDANPDPNPRRLTAVETIHLPAPPPLRAHVVRAARVA